MKTSLNYCLSSVKLHREGRQQRPVGSNMMGVVGMRKVCSMWDLFPKSQTSQCLLLSWQKIGQMCIFAVLQMNTHPTHPPPPPRISKGSCV